jgi:hypothetical protein
VSRFRKSDMASRDQIHSIKEIEVSRLQVEIESLKTENQAKLIEIERLKAHIRLLQLCQHQWDINQQCTKCGSRRQQS